ncbi:MAG: hypothetical protein A3F16_04200 [Deltaproteobacteria bacterium RIFCSPHIGHO2_12_FULL_43_9]|nr:MAG: hypothetical protein A3F16_04200 [Deltaproteobacteria bacterium RIFCSPHIGHO2_12_FULL_43_9]
MSRAEEYLKLGRERVNQNKFEEAERYFLQAIKENNELSQAFAELGTLYYDQGKFNRSISAFQKALQLDPHHTDAAISLSILYNDLGRYQDAEKVFTKAREIINRRKDGRDPYIDQKISEKHIELGDFYAKYRRYDEALEEYCKAVNLNDDSCEAKLKIAKICEVKGQKQRAMRELKKIKSTNPAYAPALIQLGLLLYSQGRVLDAIREWEVVLNRDSQNQEAQMYLKMAQAATTTTL